MSERREHFNSTTTPHRYQTGGNARMSEYLIPRVAELQARIDFLERDLAVCADTNEQLRGMLAEWLEIDGLTDHGDLGPRTQALLGREPRCYCGKMTQEAKAATGHVCGGGPTE